MKYILKIKYAILLWLFLCLIVGIQASSASQIERERRHKDKFNQPFLPDISQIENQVIPLKSNLATDLRLSESISPATFKQGSSSMAFIDSGKIAIAWQDDRLGSMKIFAQIIDTAGNFIGKDFMVIGRQDGYDLIEPKIISAHAGGFYLAWLDLSARKIYAAKYDLSFNRIVEPFIINDSSSLSCAGLYDMDCFNDDRLVVVWEDCSDGNEISLRVFDSTGIAISEIVKVNSGIITNNLWQPSIAVIKNGSEMGIVWEDYRNGNADIYMRLMNSDGVPIDAEFPLVSAAYDDSAQYLPSIAFSGNDGYAVGWLDNRDGKQRAYLQRVLPGGIKVGDNNKISDSDSLSEDWDITLAVNSENKLAASWASIGQSGRIVLQKFGDGFAPSGSTITTNQFLSGNRWETGIAYGFGGRLFSSWTDFRNGNPDIFFQGIDTSGVAILSVEKKVNDDSKGAHSMEPDIVPIDQNRNGVVFTDARYDDGDIFIQLVGANGSLIGKNIRINSDSFYVSQSEPAIAAASLKTLVVWNDSRAVTGVTGSRIFGRFLNYNGGFLASDFSISDSSNISPKSNPALAFAHNDNALVLWAENRGGTSHIIGRFVKQPSTIIGDDFEISIQGIEYDNTDINIGRDGNNIFTVAYLSHALSGAIAVSICRLSENGAQLSRFSFASDIPNMNINDIAVTVNDSGDIYLLWQGIGLAHHIYLTILSPDGNIKNPTFEITNNNGINPQEPDISINDNGYLMASWVDSRNGRRQAYYQLFLGDMTPFESNTPVSDQSVEFMASPAVVSYRGRAWISWVDPRSEGLNIYLTQNLLITTDIDDWHNDLLPFGFALNQNYPNPFNPHTNIEFSIPNLSVIKISIYNMLGQKVKTLANGLFDAGHYSLEWDGNDSSGRKAASGVYLYKLHTEGFEISKKMILLK
jgi:hypothetical protein